MPLGSPAYHGLVGELVRLVEPHSEGDPAAILLSLLTACGNTVGRGPHWTVNGTHHHCAIYTVIVGKTSGGRKGTATDDALWTLRLADEEWFARCTTSGLSSGEGLVYAVRDAVERARRPRKGEEPGEDGLIRESDDPGVSDKRLLVIESEYAQALKVLRREGNTLSPVVRRLWDSGSAGALTKSSLTRTTGAHISIIGHITTDELRRQLDSAEIANGFANRFLIVCARRSKSLPQGGCLTDEDIRPYAARLRQALDYARTCGEVGMDDEAREIWEPVYTRLTADRPGVAGAVCARAHANVRRLAVVYAVLDRTDTVTADHLFAALEVWRYCEDSVRVVFADALGDTLADKFLDALRRAGTAGLSRSEIREVVGTKSMPANRIGEALQLLADAGLAERFTIPTAGRPSEHWRVRQRGHDYRK